MFICVGVRILNLRMSIIRVRSGDYFSFVTLNQIITITKIGTELQLTNETAFLMCNCLYLDTTITTVYTCCVLLSDSSIVYGVCKVWSMISIFFFFLVTSRATTTSLQLVSPPPSLSPLQYHGPISHYNPQPPPYYVAKGSITTVSKSRT